MNDAFFEETRAAYQQLTELFDIIHPIRVSYWNLKCDVNGFISLYPEVRQNQLNDRYDTPKKFRGVDYKKSFIDTSMEQFESRLAWMALSTLFSIYEGWVEQMASNVFNSSSGYKLNVKKMTTAGSDCDVEVAINNCCMVPSQFAYDTFGDTLMAMKHYTSVPLNEMMKCYKYYKAMRNSYTHRGGVADAELVKLYNEYKLVESSLGLKRVLETTVPQEGEIITVPIRGVIGFGEVIIKIIMTCDCHLCNSEVADNYLLSRILGELSKINISTSNGKAEKQLKSICRKAGFPRASDTKMLVEYLKNNEMMVVK